MRHYFWVNQGATYKDEVSGGCLWAPERDGHGATLNHWESMTIVQPGDIIFTYAKSHLRGYAVATSAATPMARPYASGRPYLPSQGGRVVFCEYKKWGASLPFTLIASNSLLVAALSSGANPVLNSKGTVSQKYLCQISDSIATELEKLLGITAPLSLPSLQSKPLDKTTVQQLVDARLGQGKFRDDLFAVFGDQCPITALNESKLLRASHIRPWRESSNADRLDPENGLLLAAGIDAAFDCGIVGFDKLGGLLVKPGFSASLLAALGFPKNTALPPRFLTPKRLDNLEYHRKKFSL